MASFVLIPGAMHGRWTWNRVVPILKSARHAVIAPDMPGMGRTCRSQSKNVTLKDWRDYVAELVRGARAPVILTGHSRGGPVIGEAAERVPERLDGLIYLTALPVPPGQSVADVTGHKPDRKDELAAIALKQLYSGCSPEDTD